MLPLSTVYASVNVLKSPCSRSQGSIYDLKEIRMNIEQPSLPFEKHLSDNKSTLVLYEPLSFEISSLLHQEITLTNFVYSRSQLPQILPNICKASRAAIIKAKRFSVLTQLILYANTKQRSGLRVLRQYLQECT